MPGLDPLAARRFDPDDTALRALAYRKLAFALDDRVTYWWMRGTRYAVVGSTATALWHTWIATWATTRGLPDGAWEVTMASCILNTPLDGEQLLEACVNPLNGNAVTLAYPAPRAIRTTCDGRQGNPYAGPPSAARPAIRKTDLGPAWQVGDDLHLQADVIVDTTQGGTPPRRFVVNDWVTYVGALADVLDPGLASAPATQYFNDWVDFPAWLRMDSLQGAFVSRCCGRKEPRYEAMPAPWRRLFERHFPDAARDPAAVLRG